MKKKIKPILITLAVCLCLVAGLAVLLCQVNYRIPTQEPTDFDTALMLPENIKASDVILETDESILKILTQASYQPLEKKDAVSILKNAQSLGEQHRYILNTTGDEWKNKTVHGLFFDIVSIENEQYLFVSYLDAEKKVNREAFALYEIQNADELIHILPTGSAATEYRYMQHSRSLALSSVLSPSRITVILLVLILLVLLGVGFFLRRMKRNRNK